MDGRKRERKFCEHCDTLLAKSTYYEHRSQFYSKETNTWEKLRQVGQIVSNVSSSSGESDSSEEDDRMVIISSVNFNLSRSANSCSD